MISNQEKLKRLIENTKEHVNSVMLNFANEFHKIVKEMEKGEK